MSWLMAALASPATVAAEPPLTVVMGRALGHFSIAAEIPCPKDDICMDAWIGWNIEATDVLAGAPATGRIRAARIQHAWFVPGYLRRFKLFVLEPIADPELRDTLHAEYLLRDFAESMSMLCTRNAPKALGISAEPVFVEQDVETPQHCFVAPEGMMAEPASPSLAFAATAGHWEADGSVGAYRVLVFNAGFEHVSSRVVAQWVADPADSAGVPTVSSERELVAPGSFSLGAPQVVRTRTGIRVTFRGVVPHSPGRAVSCVFELYPQGEVKVVKPCG